MLSSADERGACNPTTKAVNRYIEIRNCRTPVPKRCTDFPVEGGTESTVNWWRNEVLTDAFPQSSEATFALTQPLRSQWRSGAFWYWLARCILLHCGKAGQFGHKYPPFCCRQYFVLSLRDPLRGFGVGLCGGQWHTLSCGLGKVSVTAKMDVLCVSENS